MNAQSNLTQLNKRRLDFGVDVETFKVNERRVPEEQRMEEDEVSSKRRRRLLEDSDARRRPFPVHRPHLPRIHDDENLIKETQAALHTLSGSWPREIRAHAHVNEDVNGFENLFEDKRSLQTFLPTYSPSPSSASPDASQNSYNNNRQNEDNGDREGRLEINESNLGNYSDKAKSNVEYSSKSNKHMNSYEGPDFDEIADSTSNELEIDMSDRNDEHEDDLEKTDKKKSDCISVNKQMLFNVYKAATASLTNSTESAFKPPAEVRHRVSSVPSEPFGGYSGSDGRSKQYTVLQPAGAGSRALSALADARSVPSATPARTSALSPSLHNNLNRGTSRTTTLLTRATTRLPSTLSNFHIQGRCRFPVMRVLKLNDFVL